MHGDRLRMRERARVREKELASLRAFEFWVLKFQVGFAIPICKIVHTCGRAVWPLIIPALFSGFSSHSTAPSVFCGGRSISETPL